MKLFFIRRRLLAGVACALAVAGIFYTVNHPAIVGVAATTRQLPIYSVDKDQKVCSISFDAAWGDVIIRPLRLLVTRVPAVVLLHALIDQSLKNITHF